MALDSAGAPYFVCYHLLASMRLNEPQKQQRMIEEMREQQMALLGALREGLDA